MHITVSKTNFAVFPGSVQYTYTSSSNPLPGQLAIFMYMRILRHQEKSARPCTYIGLSMGVAIGLSPLF